MSGLSPSALRVRNRRRTATRMSVSIGVAVLVMATVVPVPTALASDVAAAAQDGSGPWRHHRADTRSVLPRRRQGQLRRPAVPKRHHWLCPGDGTDGVWPVTGAGRVVWLVFGPPEVWGPGGSAWPNEPCGSSRASSTSPSISRSNRESGTWTRGDPRTGGDHLVIFGYSQGAIIANQEKQKLQDQYPHGNGPDIEFVLIGDPHVPNGGLSARFPGLDLPIIDFTFTGPAPTDTSSTPRMSSSSTTA